MNSNPDEQNEFTKRLYERLKLKGFQKCPGCSLGKICHCKKSQFRRCKDSGICCYFVEAKKKKVNGVFINEGVQMTLKEGF